MKDKSVGQSANGVRFQHCQFHKATCPSHNRLVGGFIMDESMTVIEITPQARYFRIGNWSFGYSSACQVRAFILPGVFKYNFEACKGLCSHISLSNPRCPFELETAICLINLKST